MLRKHGDVSGKPAIIMSGGHGTLGMTKESDCGEGPSGSSLVPLPDHDTMKHHCKPPGNFAPLFCFPNTCHYSSFCHTAPFLHCRPLSLSLHMKRGILPGPPIISSAETPTNKRAPYVSCGVECADICIVRLTSRRHKHDKANACAATWHKNTRHTRGS